MLYVTKARILLLHGATLLLLSTLPGCLATRGWVQEQMAPLDGRVTGVEGRMGEAENRISQVDAKADKALANFEHLRLTRRFILSLKDGATFAPNSEKLTAEAQHQIDGFLSDLEHSEDLTFLVAGHTDNNGTERQNYELGQRRAAAVARYLASRKGVDPLRITTMSYGSTTPIAKNTTPAGRQKNRRIEILVYKEGITTETASAPTTASY